MVDSDFGLPRVQRNEDPRYVSRGSNLQLAFLGIDSLYLVMEYPSPDVFEKWSKPVGDLHNPRLFAGIPFQNLVIRHGGNGYKLSVWDGDARLYLTDRVNNNLQNSSQAGQGMGLMLQLGPKWLRQYGDIVSPSALAVSVLEQFSRFGVNNLHLYPIRINRLDIAADVLGLDVKSLSIEQWRQQWVGRARQKHFYDSPESGQLSGFSIGSSEGAVRFKVYDKLAESLKRGTFDFWWSVWASNAVINEFVVARFEWSIKCYDAGFEGIQYLSEFTFDGFLRLLNYVSDKWGRLCLPLPDDDNKSRWPLDPLWAELRRLLDEWSFNFKDCAHREYDNSLYINDSYLAFMAGCLAGLAVRVGLALNKNTPATLRECFQYLEDNGHSLSDIEKKTLEKWSVAARLAGKQVNDGYQ